MVTVARLVFLFPLSPSSCNCIVYNWFICAFDHGIACTYRVLDAREYSEPKHPVLVMLRIGDDDHMPGHGLGAQHGSVPYAGC
jgi:hypothetical protein